MENIFLHLVNMSITATWITLAVILLRFVLKKSPKWSTGLLWGLVALRLVCPFSIESMFSLIPSTQTIPQNIAMSTVPQIDSGIGFINQAINPVISEAFSPNIETSVNPMQIVIFIATILWLVGIAAMFIYTAVSYLHIHKKVREAVKNKDGIWVCDHISTPFILGIIRPKIYLPSSMNEADTE